MGWAKFDDRWPTHPKLLAAGLEAKGLDASGICYAAGQETDGFIPDSALSILAAGHRNPHKVARVLVEVGRWARDDDRKGYVIHDYLDYNPTRESREAERVVKREAGRRGGMKSRPGVSKTEAGGSTVLEAEPKQPGEAEPKQLGEPPSRPGPFPPQVPRGATNGRASIGKGEEDGSRAEPTPTPPPADTEPVPVAEPVEHPKLLPLAEHLARSLWPDRPRMLVESKLVVGRCLAVADPSLVDECIGAMITADDPPRTPKYLLATVRNRLVGMGAYAAGDEALATLGGRK